MSGPTSQPSGHSSSRSRGRLKPGEVCARFDIQPYVLKFWEGEFPQLGRRLGTRRTYGPREIEIVEAIHALVEEQGLNLAEAREVLAERFDSELEAGEGVGGGPAAVTQSPPGAKTEAEAVTGPEPASAGVMAEASARIRELERRLAEAEERTETLVAQARADAAGPLEVQLAGKDAAKDAELSRLAAEWEQKLAELARQADERVRQAEEAAARRAADEQAGLQQELEGLREQVRARMQRAESERDVAFAHVQELETALGQERLAGRERDARLAREVATAMVELSTVGGLANDLLQAISGRAFEASEADEADEADDDVEDPAAESPDEAVGDDGPDEPADERQGPDGGGESPPLPRDGLF